VWCIIFEYLCILTATSTSTPSFGLKWLLISLGEKYLFLEKKYIIEKTYILENIYIIEKKVSS